MPLWKIYHPPGVYSAEDKQGLSERITALYSRLPKFYVGVVFQEVAADSFYVGGKGYQLIRFCSGDKYHWSEVA